MARPILRTPFRERRLLSLNRFSLSSRNFEEKAFTERLQQLKDSNTIQDDDPLLGKNSIVDQDERLLKIQKTSDQKQFEYENQAIIQTSTNLPNFANKHVKQLAYSAPWKGEESLNDSNLRMLIDKHKPLRGINKSAKKLGVAKETVLDYRINKNSEKDEDLQFRNLYKEKFTPIGSFDKIKSVADARIEEAMRNGAFDNLPRGKKLNLEVKPYVDRTEHHLNNILINQNIAPPWIEKQGGVDLEIETFKRDLKLKLINHVRIHHKIFDNKNDDKFESLKSHFIKTWKFELDQRLKLLNSSIRTYNLQAPLSTQKLYIVMDRELNRALDSIDVGDVITKEKQKIEEAKLTVESNALPRFSFKFWNWG